jgi:hypothetical protein
MKRFLEVDRKADIVE